MGFCDFTKKDGVFVLTINGRDGHNYLDLQSMEELYVTLQKIRSSATRSSKGLVTTGAGGTFCDGVDYEASSPLMVRELTYRMAEVMRLLFEMPFPTVAAVSGDVKTSLAMALALSHDDLAVFTEANFVLPEVRDGRNNLPPYLGALLRDRAPFPLTRSKLAMQSQALLGSYLCSWEVFEATPTIKENTVDRAIGIITGSIGRVRREEYITTRKSFFPESWKAVSDFLGNDNK